MIPVAITMTTDIKTASAKDIFVKNEVVNLDRVSLVAAKPLAGMGWQAVASSPQEALLLALRVVLALLKEKLPHLEIWLLAGTSVWQPNTRIVRYYKLWAALKMRGLDIQTDSPSMEEVSVESDRGLKFFGAMKLSEFAQDSIIAKTLLEERCTYLVAMPSHFSPSPLLNIGWSGELSDDAKLIDFLAEADGLLLKQMGEFEAHERGVVAIGHPSLIDALS